MLHPGLRHVRCDNAVPILLSLDLSLAPYAHAQAAMSTLLEYITLSPLNSAVIALNSVLFLYAWNARLGVEEVALSYRRVVAERQYYRCVTAAFTHLDAMHILFNMGALVSVAPLEAARGSAWYAETTLLLLVASMSLHLAAVHVAVTRGATAATPAPLAAWADSSAVGYSGVIFGWLAIVSQLAPGGKFFGLDVPSILSPFLSLAVTQLLVPRASFLGHFAGIIAGFVVVWGALDSMRGYWAVVITVGGALVAVASLRANPRLRVPAWVDRIVLLRDGDGAGGGAGAVRADVPPIVRRQIIDGVLRNVSPETASPLPPPPPRSVLSAVNSSVAALTSNARAFFSRRGAAALPSAGEGAGAAAGARASATTTTMTDSTEDDERTRFV